MNDTLSGLSFGKAISRVFSKYATFGGRATRSEYWWFFLFTTIVNAVLNALAGGERGSGEMGFFEILSVLVTLAFILPALAVGIRRLHDTNRSGWWILIALIPVVGVIVLIVFYVGASDASDNQYGPAPVPAS